MTGDDGYLDQHGDELVAFRRHLHANPELSGREFDTTELIAERLRAAGLRPRVLSSGTGLICDIGSSVSEPGASSRPIVALRADIDALAMDDTKTVSYRSRVDGRAHCCGHDVHTTMVLGAGLALAAQVRDGVELGGVVRLLFEPAEETVPGGAQDVITDGGVDGVTAVYGFHCDPKLDVGRFGLRSGPLTAATDLVRVTLRGPGGHTARPHLTVDLVAVAGRVAADLPDTVRRIVGDRGTMLVVFGSLHAGDAANVIPTVARLQGSVRVPDRVLWDEAETIVASALDELVGDTGVQIELDYQRGIPPVVNHSAEIERMRRAIGLVAGPDAAIEAALSFGGDSFSWYLERVPGAYVRIGVADPALPLDERLDLHSGAFDVDERVITLGSRVLAEVATARLAEG